MRIIKLLPGVVLMIVGFIAMMFFDNYRGTMIPHPFMFFLLGIAIAVFGLILLIVVFQTIDDQDETVARVKINQLKEKAEKIVPDFDSCEFKGTDYQEEVQDSSVRVHDLSYKSLENVDIEQSALVYVHKTGNTTERFTSQVFPMAELSLKAHILKGDLLLYVDRFDRTNYFFELNR